MKDGLGREPTCLAEARPDLVAEWDKRKNRELGLSPRKINRSSMERVWWICSRGHEWIASVYSRVYQHSGCPVCSKRKTESGVARGLKQYCKEKYSAISEYQELRNPDTGAWLPYDIYIPSKGVYIEIHGKQHYTRVSSWHTEEDFQYRQRLDKLKREHAERYGIYLEIDLRVIKTARDAVLYLEMLFAD